MVTFTNINVWNRKERNFDVIDLEYNINHSLSDLKLTEIDSSDLFALPPLIDIHVHFREPGFIHKETIASGSLAALHGGILTVLDMPNTNPITDSVSTILQKKEISEKQNFVKVLIACALTNNNSSHLNEIEEQTDAYKVFMSESFGNLAINYENIEQSLSILEELGTIKPIIFHAEDPKILENYKNEIIHSRRRPAEAEASAIQQILSWASEYRNLKFHITHISSILSLRLLELTNKSNVTLDTCPRYLYFNENSSMDDNYKQVNPPLRSSLDNNALLKSVAIGLIDMISSDHSPHTIEEKTRQSISGMPGVQELVPSILSLVRAGEIEWERALEALYEFPSKLLNLPVTNDRQNIVIFDLNKPINVTKDWIKSKSKWSPFENYTLFGNLNYVIKEGQIVYANI